MCFSLVNFTIPFDYHWLFLLPFSTFSITYCFLLFVKMVYKQKSRPEGRLCSFKIVS